MSYILAHDWDILGEERIPRWPSKTGEKRKIKINISTWVGTLATEAKHYDVTVTEEANQWWCEEKGAWVELTCDDHQVDYSLSATVLSHAEAMKVAQLFVALITTNREEEYLVCWPNQEREDENEEEI